MVISNNHFNWNKLPPELRSLIIKLCRNPNVLFLVKQLDKFNREFILNEEKSIITSWTKNIRINKYLYNDEFYSDLHVKIFKLDEIVENNRLFIYDLIIEGDGYYFNDRIIFEGSVSILLKCRYKYIFSNHASQTFDRRYKKKINLSKAFSSMIQ